MRHIEQLFYDLYADNKRKIYVRENINNILVLRFIIILLVKVICRLSNYKLKI